MSANVQFIVGGLIGIGIGVVLLLVLASFSTGDVVRWDKPR